MSADSSGNGHRLNTIRPPQYPRGISGGFRGSQTQMFGEAVKWLDRLAPNLVKSADSSGNGYTPFQFTLRDTRGHLGVLGVKGHTFKSMEKLSNGWNDWHQLWFTSADSSRNGHRLNTSHPTIPQGAFWGILGGDKFKCLGKLSDCSTDWHQIWYMSADSSGNGHS